MNFTFFIFYILEFNFIHKGFILRMMFINYMKSLFDLINLLLRDNIYYTVFISNSIKF